MIPLVTLVTHARDNSFPLFSAARDARDARDDASRDRRFTRIRREISYLILINLIRVRLRRVVASGVCVTSVMPVTTAPDVRKEASRAHRHARHDRYGRRELRMADDRPVSATSLRSELRRRPVATRPQREHERTALTHTPGLQTRRPHS